MISCRERVAAEQVKCLGKCLKFLHVFVAGILHSSACAVLLSTTFPTVGIALLALKFALSKG
jgi:hypothetical protein